MYKKESDSPSPLKRVNLVNPAGESEKGGTGVFMDFAMFRDQLISIGQMNVDEVIQQVDVYPDGLVFLFKKV